ncbi:MAG: 30S ribosomal protein S20 [Myxococcota bacterium]
MANHKSAAKRARQTEVRTLRNRKIKSRTRTAVKAFRAAIDSKDEKAKELLALATQSINKAASKGVIHKRTAARSVSRLVQAYKKFATS